MKTIALKVLGSDRMPVDIVITPGVTASDILTKAGLEGFLLFRKGEQRYFQPEEVLYGLLTDGEMLCAYAPICGAY
jgi:hypothetical protein